MTTPAFVAAARDLAQALRAVAPFTNPKADYLGLVRLTTASGNVYVTASDGTSAALALVSAWDDGTGIDGTVIDLSAADAKTIAGVMPGQAPNPQDEGQPQDEVTVELDDGKVVVTDTSGLFAGRSVTVALQPRPEHSPNVLRVIAHRLEGARPTQDDLGPRFNPPALAKVCAAAKVYGAPVRLAHHAAVDPDRTGQVLARVGDSFLALLSDSSTGRWQEDVLEEEREHARAWSRRLAGLPAVAGPGDVLLERSGGG